MTFSHTSPAQSISADSLFAEGKLAEARAAYERDGPLSPERRLRLGLLALWQNRLSSADSLLTRAVSEDASRVAVEAMAEVRYRQKRFDDAARWNRELGRHAMAAKLASLSSPFDASVPSSGTTIPFEPGTVLPVLRAEVNGIATYLLLDTGASTLVLDTAFARTIGARAFGIDSSVFAGGQRGQLTHATIDTLRLGNARLRNVPVQLMPTQRYAAAAGGRNVDGIIGTGVLAQYRATIDFGAGALTLVPSDAPASASGVVTPFWLLGDHFITVPAIAAGLHALLVFDTGLAMPGGALVPSAWLISEANQRVTGPSFAGLGGGGEVRVTPFRFSRVALGSLVRDSVLAVAGAFPEVLERRFGARVAGLISHGFFAGQRVTLDFAAMTLTISPSSPAAVPAADASAPPSAVPLSADSIVARSRRIVSLLRDRQYTALDVYWAAALRERVSPATLGASWEGLVAAVGPVVDIQPTELTSSGAVRSTRTLVKLTRISVAVGLTFNAAGQVTGVEILPQR